MMKVNKPEFLVYFSIIFMFTAESFGAGLPMGKVGKTARKKEAKKAVEIKKCTDWHATPLGGFGKLNAENNEYEQVYLAAVGKKNKYVYEVVDLDKIKSKSKLSVKLPKMDQAIFPQKKEGSGLLFVNYKNNSDHCFDGVGRLTAISLVKPKVGKSKSLQVTKDAGRYTSYGLGSENSIANRKSNELIRFQYEPFVKKYTKTSLPQNERLLHSNEINIDKGNVSLVTEAGKEYLVKRDRSKSGEDKLQLKPGDRMVRNGGSIAILRPSPSQNMIYFLESKIWTGSDNNKVYKLKTPKSISANRTTVFHSTKTGILFMAADSKFFRSRWNDVLVMDYKSGKLLSQLDLPDGSIAGEIHYDSQGKVGVVEEVSSSNGTRIALHVFKLSNLVWQKITY